jgi:aryl-alcohol dehydrogenase-like predicted oxidoreductase
MSKIDARSKVVTLGQIDESLRRLQTDVLDLVQIHEVIRMEDPDWCFAPGGAIEGLVEARRLSKIRYIGFTGHKDPAIHLRMLEVARANGFAFDTVQMPLSVVDHHFHYHSFERLVLPVLISENAGVLAMKTMAMGRVPQSGAVSAVECLRYAMSLPTSVVITGCETVERLEQAIRTATTFQPLTPAETADILDRARDLGNLGESEPWKTTTNNDSTSRNPDWMWEKVAWA